MSLAVIWKVGRRCSAGRNRRSSICQTSCGASGLRSMPCGRKSQA